MAASAVGDPQSAPQKREGDPAVLALVAEPYADVADARRRLHELLAVFEAREDGRAQFLTVYAATTAAVARRIRRGGFADPEWVGEYLVAFANRYRKAVYHHETGDHESLSSAWRAAFDAAERPDASAVRTAALGVNAHINYDLAFALADVGIDDDRETRRADHAAVTEVIATLLRSAWDSLAARDAGENARSLEPLDERLGVAAIDACRDSAWRTAVALHSGLTARRRMARAKNAVTAAAAARLLRAHGADAGTFVDRRSVDDTDPTPGGAPNPRPAYEAATE